MLKTASIDLKKIWAQVPTDYYFKMNYFQKTWHDWKWIVFKHLLTLDGFSPKSILEIGCASGHLTQDIHELFPKAKMIGVDVYKPAIEEAKKRYPDITFYTTDAHKLPFKENTFDLVVCSETIEHVVDPSEALHEMSRVLKPSGRALIEMDSGSPLFRVVWFFWSKFGKGRVWNNAHLHPFKAKELEWTINSKGFLISKRIFSHFGMAVSFLVEKGA